MDFGNCWCSTFYIRDTFSLWHPTNSIKALKHQEWDVLIPMLLAIRPRWCTDVGGLCRDGPVFICVCGTRFFLSIFCVSEESVNVNCSHSDSGVLFLHNFVKNSEFLANQWPWNSRYVIVTASAYVINCHRLYLPCCQITCHILFSLQQFYNCYSFTDFLSYIDNMQTHVFALCCG